MALAIVGYFDPESDARVKSLWRLMADAGINDYLIGSENDPHFKFLMLEHGDPASLQTRLAATLPQQVIRLHFKKFGFYPGTQPFLTLDLADNAELLACQRSLHDAIGCEGPAARFFSPGVWKPDIQLTTPFDAARLPLAASLLNEIELPFDGTLQSVGVIEFPPAKQLFRLALG